MFDLRVKLWLSLLPSDALNLDALCELSPVKWGGG